MTLKQIILLLNEFIPKMVGISIGIVILILCLEMYRKWRNKQKKELKKGLRKKAHGVIFGKKGMKLVYSPENAEGHIGVFSASGTGKTSAVGIPTLRAWRGTSYTIDISGDICKNCQNMSNKLIYCLLYTSPSPRDTR